MKLALLTLVTLVSVSSFAQKYDGDIMDVYHSWCDHDNIILSGVNPANAIVKNCASEQKVCVLDQRTSGKRVIYSARCEDAPVKYGRE